MFQLAGWQAGIRRPPFKRKPLKFLKNKRFKTQKLSMRLHSTPPLCGAKKVKKMTFSNSKFKQKNHLNFVMFIFFILAVFLSWHASMGGRRPTRPTKRFFGSVVRFVGCFENPSQTTAIYFGRPSVVYSKTP